jgi:hypothetical protein
MADSFVTGEDDAESSAPSIETMGARYGIKVSQPGRGDHQDLTEPYLMPSVHGRNGSLEKVDPAITQTPLGGMMPGPYAIAPAVPAGNVGAFHCNDNGGFGSGVIDGYPEGAPIPITG